VCFAPKPGSAYHVRNLSCSGALLEGGNLLPPGSRVDLHLRFPGSKPVPLAGTVVRTTVAAHHATRLAVAFTLPTADDEDDFAEMVAREVAKRREPTCLVASASRSERRLLTRRLETLGCTVLQASTPVEVVHRLENHGDSVDVAILGGLVGRVTGVQLASFVAAAYPRIKCVLAGASASGRRTSAEDESHEVILPPWTEERLRSAVGQRISRAMH
jgi:hypothetical protein